MFYILRTVAGYMFFHIKSISSLGKTRRNLVSLKLKTGHIEDCHELLLINYKAQMQELFIWHIS